MWKIKKYLFKAFLSLLCLIQLSEGALLRCYKGSLTDYQVAPLNQPLPPNFISCLNPTLPTVIYTFGYTDIAAGRSATGIVTAYLSTKKRNVLLVDWQEEARGGLGLLTGYSLHAVPNARIIGGQLGDVLIQLVQSGINMTDFHLLGHSLGAQLMGFAGRRARARGYVVPRITGFDPAHPLFEGLLAIPDGLDHTCAAFVDIIHTDPGRYGYATSKGTVDIWPNFVGVRSLQPGCPFGIFIKFSIEDLCSHERSWRFYEEAIYSPTALPAVKAMNYYDWAMSGGQVGDTIYLGELTRISARGNYFLRTNALPPYGRGAAGMSPR